MKSYQQNQQNLKSSSSLNQPLFQGHVYSKLTLIILTIGYIVSWILFFADPAIMKGLFSQTDSTQLSPGVLGTIGTIGFIVIVVVLLVIDWRGFTTLNGWIKWKRMKAWQKIVLGYFFIGLSIFLVGPYLIQAYRAYSYNKSQEPMRLRQKIAEQEAQLGIMPQTKGTCRNCRKQLQLGATFCVYCGTTVTEQPKVCPNCATVTLSDAKWCPNCRAALV
jgi:RNA polymerase subunit RPABC4/transcription elongation factor Spt4